MRWGMFAMSSDDRTPQRWRLRDGASDIFLQLPELLSSLEDPEDQAGPVSLELRPLRSALQDLESLEVPEGLQHTD